MRVLLCGPRAPAESSGCDKRSMNYMDDSDEILIERHALGDVAAFELLYRRHELRTWRYLERNVGSRTVADELMQSLWFAVARDSISYEPKGRFAKWLFSIAHLRVVEYAKASYALSVPAATAEEQSVLIKALAQLPREPRDAYLLQVEGELTVEEISAVTHCAIEMAQARLLYARTMLSELLAEFATTPNTGAPVQKAPAAVASAPKRIVSPAVASAPRRATAPAAPATQIYAASTPAPRTAAQGHARMQNLNLTGAAVSRGGNTESTSPADTPSASQTISVPRNDMLVAAAASAAATNPAVVTPPVIPVVRATAEIEVWIS